MLENLINDAVTNTDRNRLFIIYCDPKSLLDCKNNIQNYNINCINIGHEIARFANETVDFRFISDDICDHLKLTLTSNLRKINNIGNDIVAVYNIGILFEPTFELNPTYLFKEFSKTSALIIIWENQSDLPDRLHWPTQQKNIFLDFKHVTLKKMHYAI